VLALARAPSGYPEAWSGAGSWTGCAKTSSPPCSTTWSSAPRWVIDGNYASTLPIRLAAADMVIFLDLPARACLCGIAQRRLRYGGGQHQAIGVYDRITWGFVRYILGYRRSMAPRVHALIVGYATEAEVIVLRSRRAARRYLAGVTAAQPAGVLSG
jgi:adenylate kinase family enzyme